MSFTALLFNEDKLLKKKLKFSSIPQLRSLKVSQHFTVLHHGININNISNLNEIYISDREPVRIYPRTNKDLEKIHIRTQDLRAQSFYVDLSTTVYGLIFETLDTMGYSERNASLYFRYRRLMEDCSLSHYGISKDSILWLSFRCVGGGGHNPIDKTDDSIPYGKIAGWRSNHWWQMYQVGLNILGFCTNQKCISYPKQNYVVHKQSFGRIKFKTGKKLLGCPACTENTFQIMSGQQFLISCCRTLVRFKRNEDDVAEYLFLETGKDPNKFKTFGLEDDWVNYFMAEITTVSLSSSPFYCVACDFGIKEAEKEIVLSCGHAYHVDCLTEKNAHRDCCICHYEEKDEPLDDILKELVLSTKPLGSPKSLLSDQEDLVKLTDKGGFETWYFESSSCKKALINEGIYVKNEDGKYTLSDKN